MLPYKPEEVLTYAEKGERPNPLSSEVKDCTTQGTFTMLREEEGTIPNHTSPIPYDEFHYS